ncbi:MEKHLA domain-containing protein [Prochlorococcus sp. MIT 1307]|uniref:MEKHLA domain-containing protein n=1 Tax=Prochlorococcus sp. MIT 1307 TaxID=3096219 RepID=UPI002A74F29C|nr:MEKHLA domain-containing protein [Prochlorococcus sp. MIT 1307]
MNKAQAPWHTKKTLRVIHLLLTSYQNAFKQSLLNSPEELSSQLQQAKILFALKEPVIAHNNEKDPCLNYANAAALQLWGRGWDEMIGMPSRLTAPIEEREERQYALNKAITKHAVKDYEGIRINSKGEVFMIKNARIWTIFDENGELRGQAATFDWWQKI